MNPTVSQVVTPTTAIFPEQPMADVIDSLKRLERLGDENSKTVQKILQASQDIENRVLDLYRYRPVGTMIRCKEAFTQEPPSDSSAIAYISDDKQRAAAKTTHDAAVAAFDTHAAQIGVAPELYDRSYTIGEHRGHRRLLRCSQSGPDEWVSENRDSALRFADDIAKGLLIAIAADLLRQRDPNDAGLAMLTAATEYLQGVARRGERLFISLQLTPEVPKASRERARTLIERRTNRKIVEFDCNGTSTTVVLDSSILLDPQAADDIQVALVADLQLPGMLVQLA
jgi:hypothetical protein